MAVKIRLMRIGSKHRPFYRVVAVDERRKRTGSYLELLGTYNPLTQPKEIILKQDRIKYWLEHGAVASTGYLRIIGQAKRKNPRQPKKASQSNEATPVPPPIEPATTPGEIKDEAKIPNPELLANESPTDQPSTPDSKPPTKI